LPTLFVRAAAASRAISLPPLLRVGTKDDVITYCKKLIDVVGKDGGCIPSPRSSVEEVKPENLKAMIDFPREYGVYN
jgi:hypothetical protein